MMKNPPPGGWRVLVAEDEALISVMLSSDLRDEGYRIAGPFSRCDEALAWLQGETPDAAILDYMLRDGACTMLALALRERSVPFIIFSAYLRGPDMAAELHDAPWFDKPASADTLLAALAALPLGSAKTEPK